MCAMLGAMAPTSFRLDTLAVRLLAQLEAHRRTWRADPERASRELTKIAEDQVAAMVAEQADLGPGPRYAAAVADRLQHTFMPRYERLALEQNALEEAGWKSWRGGDPIGRIVSGLVMLLLAVALTRLVRNPAVVVAYMGVVLVPLGPEIRALWHGWQYRRALQSIVDDLGNIQEELDRIDEVDLDRELARDSLSDTRETTGADDAVHRPRPPQGERTP